MAVNAKLGVDLSSFEQGIRTGQTILKGLNAEMKATEAEFKATGNSEQKLANQTKTLNSTLQVQKGIVDNAKNALKAMDDAGVKPTDASYQKLYATMMNATAGMNEAQAQLNALGNSAQDAATGADQLTTSVNKIGKKISLDQVISGINSIESGLERAAQKAVQLGEAIWNNVMDSAKWADDTATQALMFGIDVDTFQRMQKLVVNGLDTTVDAMLTAQSKLKKGIGSENKQVMQYMQELGLIFETGKGAMSFVTEDSVDLFFRAGQAIMKMGDAYDKEAAAQALFGKGWKELVPLFDTENGGFASVEEYNQALKDVQVNSEEDVKALADLNDKVGELKGNFDTLSREMMAQLAPALTDAATALNGLLESVLEYLETPEGKELLESMGKAVEGLFSDLSEIDPQKVVEGFTGVFNSIIDGFKWLEQNSGAVIGALEAIVAGWGLLELTGGALEIVKLINGITGLAGAGAAAAAGEAGAAAGASWGSAFAGAVMKAAPWLIGLYTLLNPADTGDVIGNNTLVDENGNLTREAAEYGFTLNENGEVAQDRRAIMEQIAQEAWDLYRTGKFDKEALAHVQGLLGTDEMTALFAHMQEIVKNNPDWKSLEDMNLTEWLDNFEPVQIPAELDNQTTAEDISKGIGTVDVMGHLVLTGGGGQIAYAMSEANGIHSVPYDGMLARLHKGERVVPAREVQSRSYNSNLYVESMYMNNGTDASGLAAAMAAAQRRTMSGFGS